ncbi:hypothetical protein [Amycolatopsis aidingensis]|uniref:hypothetical protein n=1 Tax=Amycolatopsis aidingensis TaxID=2842453 RepID=UPI001E3C953C|nr:hypothetical protein [Amycolatopsis aidingensis]
MKHANPISAVDPGVDPAGNAAIGADVMAGQPGWAGLAQKADLFSPSHGRQAMPENTGAPQALDIAHLMTHDAVWWVTTALVALGIAIFVLHRHLRSHHLRSRIRYDFLPTTSFDASPQSVLNFAHQLGRARPVHGWVPRSVVGVRIRFRTDDQGKMIMSVEGRESITGVINKLAYPQVETRRSALDADSVAGKENSPPEG